MKKLTSGNRSFFDTNILIYAHAGGDDPKAVIARDLILAGGRMGVQQLNEFVSVARRKLRIPWQQVRSALETLLVLLRDPVPLSLEVHERALQLAERYGFGIYDSLAIAAALQAECNVIFSEDLQDGEKVEGVVIRNPFRPA